MDGTQLIDWYPRHIVAMVFQCLSLIGSCTIILSFFVIKQRRSPFRYQILFLNIGDVVWTTSHFINHIDAVANKRVTDNKVRGLLNVKFIRRSRALLWGCSRTWALVGIYVGLS